MAAKNNLPARESIIKRADYSVNAIPFLPEANEPTLETTQLKDFLLNEKIFIGRVDGSFNPVFVNQKELDNFGPDSSTKVGLRVVTEAYKDMKRKLYLLREYQLNLSFPFLNWVYLLNLLGKKE